MEYILMKDHVEFTSRKLKGRIAVLWNQFQNIIKYQDKPPIRTWRQLKRLLQARSLALEEEEMEHRPLQYMRFYRSNETAEPHQQPQD